jgi:hypothetical protein
MQALVVLQSQEFCSHQIEGYYNTLLHRSSTPADQTRITDLVLSGIDLGSIRLGFESSPEFFAKG